MPDPAALLLAALLGAEVAAVGLAVRARVGRPLLALLTFALADELLQLLLHAWLDTAPRPLAGWARLGWHVSIALSLGWPAGLAWASHETTTRRMRDVGLGALAGLLAGLAIVYPPSRAGLRWTLLVWELCCVAVAWWGVGRRWGRAWGAAEHVLVILVSCETMVCVVGPFASDPFTRWWIARAFYLGAWGAISGVLGRGSLSSIAPRRGR